MSRMSKEYNREANRRYRERHGEALKQRKAEWYQANKDPAKEAARYAADRENQRAKRREYYQANKENVKAQVKAYAQRNPDLIVRRNLKQYGLTLEQYQKMETDQNGLCAICGKPPTKGRKRLSVDHNHTTGKVRQLLCGRCNTAIGMTDESVEILHKIIDYLKRHNQ